MLITRYEGFREFGKSYEDLINVINREQKGAFLLCCLVNVSSLSLE
jgi:hypothetical protein